VLLIDVELLFGFVFYIFFEKKRRAGDRWGGGGVVLGGGGGGGGGVSKHTDVRMYVSGYVFLLFIDGLGYKGDKSTHARYE